jgi:hypothetical protein
MVAILSELNSLDLWATNIGNAYLEAKMSELLFIIAGPELGDHEHFSTCLQDMGFFPCKAEPDIWMRRVDDHYEYITTYVFNLAICSKDPKAITDTLLNKYNFKLKGTGEI